MAAAVEPGLPGRQAAGQEGTAKPVTLVWGPCEGQSQG